MRQHTFHTFAQFSIHEPVPQPKSSLCWRLVGGYRFVYSMVYAHFRWRVVEFVERYAPAQLHEEHVLPDFAICFVRQLPEYHKVHSLVHYCTVIASRKRNHLARERVMFPASSGTFHSERSDWRTNVLL